MMSTVERGRALAVDALKLLVLLSRDVDDSVGVGSNKLLESARGFDSLSFKVLLRNRIQRSKVADDSCGTCSA